MLKRIIAGLISLMLAATVLLAVSTLRADADFSTATIQGVLTDASNGLPVSNATIEARTTLNPSIAVAAASSDPTGTYSLTGLPPGDYLIAFSDPNGGRALTFWPDAAVVRDATVVTVTPGQQLVEVDAQLRTGGVIRGTVTDRNGAPVAGSCVAVLDSQAAHGVDAIVGVVFTDTAGTFTTPPLAPVPYLVAVTDCAGTGHALEVFDNAASTEAARRVTPTPGASSTLAITVEPAGTISGAIVDQRSGGAVANASDYCVYPYLESGSPIGPGTRVNGDGTFAAYASGPVFLAVGRCDATLTDLSSFEWHDGNKGSGASGTDIFHLNPVVDGALLLEPTATAPIAGITIPVGTAALGDDAPPQLHALGIAPSSIDASASADTARTITIDAAVSDIGTGVAAIDVVAVPPYGRSAVEFASFPVKPGSGIYNPVAVRTQLVIPRWSIVGDWSVLITARDVGGNTTTIDPSEVSLADRFTITGEDDRLGPRATAGAIAARAAEIRADAASIDERTVDVSIATEDLASGVERASVRLVLDGGDAHDVIATGLGLVDGSAASGTWSGQALFPRYAAPGTWNVAVELVDGAGNTTVLTGAQLAGLGLPATIDVTGTGDTTPPAIAGWTFGTSHLATGCSLELPAVVDVFDDLSGLAGPAGITFTGPSGQRLRSWTPGRFDATHAQAGTTRGTFTFPQGVETGTWQASIDAWDASGNPSSVAAGGITIDADASMCATPHLEVTEGASAGETGLALTSAPSADVTVGLSVSSADQVLLSTDTLHFSPDNWNQPQPILASAIADGIDESDVHIVTLRFTGSSSDAFFDESIAEISISIFDQRSVPATDPPIIDSPSPPPAPTPEPLPAPVPSDPAPEVAAPLPIELPAPTPSLQPVPIRLPRISAPISSPRVENRPGVGAIPEIGTPNEILGGAEQLAEEALQTLRSPEGDSGDRSAPFKVASASGLLIILITVLAWRFLTDRKRKRVRGAHSPAARRAAQSAAVTSSS